MPHLHEDKIKSLEETVDVDRFQSAQDIQDEIFQKMSADKKLDIAAKLWLLAKALDTDKIDFRTHGRNRHTPFSRWAEIHKAISALNELLKEESL